MNLTLNAAASQQLRAAMIRAHIEDPPDEFIADGAIHRFSTNSDPKDDAGWYALLADGIPAGAYGDWRTDIKEPWHYDQGRELSDAEAELCEGLASAALYMNELSLLSAMRRRIAICGTKA
jgi:phage/plasmid primase-like uncharacterized protein